MTQLQYNLFDTGVDGSGNALAGGATDTHYILTQTQQGAAGMNAVVASPLASGWQPDSATSAWIAPSTNQGVSSSPAGNYTYQTSFNIPTAYAANGQLTGSITADNSITSATINGVDVGYSQTNAIAGFISFRINGPFNTGANTLAFVVNNAGILPNPTGLQIKNLALNYPPSITSATATQTVVSGQTANNSGTFTEPDPGDTVTLSSNYGTVTQTGTGSGTYTWTEPNITVTQSVTITATNSEGASATTTFTVNETAVPPPTLTAGGGAANTARSGGAPVPVDPNIVLTDQYGPNLTSASIAIGTNFTASEDKLVFTNQNGITGSYSSSAGILTLTGSATPAQYQAALRSIDYQDTNTGVSANDNPRTITFSLAPGAYNSANGHFYVFIQNPGISWTAAKSAADASTLYGLQGYLATLTSAAENTFAFSKTQSTGWIGASDAANPGVWAWADGPETGLQFWQGIRNGMPVGGQYNDWNAGEPNDSGNVEFYAQYLASGLWNDLSNTASVNGYLIEYGGEPGDPTLQLTSNATVNVATLTDTPVVTIPAATTSVNAPNYTIHGTADAASLVKVYNDVNHNGVVDIGESLLGSQQLAAGQTAYSFTLPLTQSSPNYFIVTATLSPANESTPAVAPTITADSTPPVLPTVTSPTAPTSTNAANATITGTAEAGSLVTIYKGPSVVGTEQLAAGQTAYSIATPLTQNAANNFTVTATDAAGNASAAASVPTITEDSIAPASPAVTTPSAAISVNTSTATITGTAEAGSTVKIYQGASVVGTQQLAAGQTAYSIAVPLNQNAANNFAVTATDAAGNQSANAAVPTITEDSIPPANPTVLTPASATSVKAGAASITGTAPADSLVKIYKDYNGNGVIDTGDVVVGSLQLTGGATSYSIAVPLDQNAANHFLVTATDAATNQSGVAIVPTITEDSTTPPMPRVTSPASPISVNTPNVTIAGVALANGLIQVYDDLNGNGAIDPGENVVASQQLTGGATNFSIPTPLTSNAASNFLVTTTNAAGTQSAPLIVPTVTQDSIAPASPVVTTPTTPTSVNAANATITGTAEAGSTVKIYQGASVVGTKQLAAGQTAYSIAVPLAQNAADNFTVTSTDAAGNQSAPAAVPTITEDSIAPASPVVTTPSAPLSINAANATITGTAEAGSTVKIYSGPSVVGTEQLAAGQTAYSIAVPLAQNAANNFTATSTDAAGNQSANAAVPTITEDSIAPASPVVTTPSAPLSVNAANATITGTAEAGSTVKIYQGASVVGTQQLAAGQTSYSIAVPLAQNAANNFTATSTDAAGNQSAPAAVPTITEDSIAPASPAVITPSAPLSVNAANATITGTAEAGSTVKIYQGASVVGTQQLAAGQTSYSIAVPLAQNAADNFTATSTDAAGNQSAPAAVPTITEDSIAPASPVVTTPSAPLSVNAANATITGTAEAGSTVKVYQGASVVGTKQLAAGQTAYSIAVPLAQNAADNFTVTSTDAAGNQSAPAAVPTITEDSIAPASPVVTNPAVPISINAANATIAGTAEAGSTVTIYSGPSVVGTQQLTSGQTSYSIAVPLVQDAPNDFAVTATDAAGNQSANAAVPTITEDSIAPNIPTVSSPSAPLSVDAVNFPVIGTAEAGSLVQVYSGPSVVGVEQLAPGQTAYSIAVPLVQNQANNFAVTATDAAGNQSANAAVPTITEDSIAPASPAVTTPTAPTSVNAANATITGTAEAGSLVQVYSGPSVVGTEQLAPGQTAYSIVTPLAQNQANDFTVTDTDAAGNPSIPAAVPTITEDSLPPAPPVVTTPTAPTSVDTATIPIAGTAEAGSLVQVYSGETLVGSEQLAPGQTAYSIAVPLAQDAANDFVITSTDTAGNPSAPAVVPTITEDSIPPAPPVVATPTAPTSINTATIPIAGTAEAGSLVTIYSGETLVGSEQLAPGQTLYGIAVPLAPNAPNDFTVTDTDAAGNPSTPAVVPTITEDSIPPAPPVVATPTAPISINAATIPIAGTAEAGSTVTIYSGPSVVGTEQLAPGQTSYSIAVPLAPNAANNFTVTSTDAAGNPSIPAVVPTITEDSIAPASPVVITPSTPTSANAANATIAGTAEAGSLVTIYNGPSVVGVEQLAAGQTAYSIAVPLAPNAPNDFAVTATDAAGTPSIPAVVPTITEDSLPPAPPIGSSPTSATTVNGTQFTLTGSAEAGSLVQVYKGTTVVGTEQLAPGQTTYSIAVPLAPNVANNFAITDTDTAGNQSLPAAVPPITVAPMIRGTVYRDLTASGSFAPADPNLAGRVVYLDLKHDGNLDAGDPTATTDARGQFSFPGYVQGTETVLEATSLDVTMRYVVDQTKVNADGSLAIGLVPYSPVAPVPVYPTPFAATSSSDANTAYVQALYHAVLDRAGDPASVAAWVSRLDLGTTRVQMAQQFVASPEHRQDQVTAYYQEFLHRAPDSRSSDWVNELLDGVSEEKVVEGFLASPEYQAAHQDSTAFVTDLYIDVLGRLGSTAEINNWLHELSTGLTRQQVLDNFVEFPETAKQIVDSFYASYLHRQPEAVTSDVWNEMLVGPDKSATEVAVGILASDEFLQKALKGGI